MSRVAGMRKGWIKRGQPAVGPSRDCSAAPEHVWHDQGTTKSQVKALSNLLTNAQLPRSVPRTTQPTRGPVLPTAFTIKHQQSKKEAACTIVTRTAVSVSAVKHEKCHAYQSVIWDFTLAKTS